MNLSRTYAGLVLHKEKHCMDTERNADETEKRNKPRKYEGKEENMKNKPKHRRSEKEKKQKQLWGQNNNFPLPSPVWKKKKVPGPLRAVMRSFMDDFTIVYGPI